MKGKINIMKNDKGCAYGVGFGAMIMALFFLTYLSYYSHDVAFWTLVVFTIMNTIGAIGVLFK